MNKLIIFLILFFIACSDKIQDRLLNPTVSLDSYAQIEKFIIFDNELKVKGVMLYTLDNKNQVIDFDYQEGKNKCIRFYWSGNLIYDDKNKVMQNNFCSFGLISGKNFQEVNFSHDLSSYGFKKLRFKIRGGYLSENVKLKIIGPKNKDEQDKDIFELFSYQLNPSWQQFELDITNNLDDINIYISFSLVRHSGNQSNGGEVFIDDIELVK